MKRSLKIGLTLSGLLALAGGIITLVVVLTKPRKPKPRTVNTAGKKKELAIVKKFAATAKQKDSSLGANSASKGVRPKPAYYKPGKKQPLSERA